MPQDSVYNIKYIVPFFHDAKNPTVNSYDLINRSLCKTEDWIASTANIIKKNDIFAFVLHSLEGAETYSFPKETLCEQIHPKGTTMAIIDATIKRNLFSPYSFLKISGIVTNSFFLNQFAARIISKRPAHPANR